METKEQLLEQHAEWAAKYTEAEARIKELLASFEDSAKGENLTVWVPTKESLVAFEKAERDVNRALEKLRKIMERLYKLR